MGAASSTFRPSARALPEPRIQPTPTETPVETISSAAAVAVRGTAPPPGQPARPGTVVGTLGARPTRRHLETAISALEKEVASAKARAQAAERDLLEAEQEKANAGIPHTECVVCLAASVSTVLLPCGHLCLCTACATSMQDNTKGCTCPLCRVGVEKFHRVFLPVEVPKPLPPEPVLPAKIEATEDEDEASSSSSIGGDPASPTGHDVCVQANFASFHRPRASSARMIRGPLSDLQADNGLPQPRVIQRKVTTRAESARGTRDHHLVERITAYNDDDIILGSSSSRGAILRPPSFNAITAAAAAEQTAATAAEQQQQQPQRLPDDVPPRGSPEDRPDSYDFVVPGAYVPNAALFSQTWDGATRVRAQ